MIELTYREGEDCPQFRKLKQLVLMKPTLQKNFQLKKDHPLKSVENLISEMSLETIPETNKEIIIRDRIEIFIPTKFRKELLEELHLTHLFTEPLKRLVCGKFWWPKINKEIEEIYSNCTLCRSEAIAKLQKPCEICPLFLESPATGR